MAKRVLTALGSDPTQGFVMLNRNGTPIWASDSVFSLVDFDANAADPLLDALHPDDVELCSEIFDVEREGVADTTAWTAASSTWHASRRRGDPFQLP